MFNPITASETFKAEKLGVTVRVKTRLFFPYFNRKKQTTVDYFDGDRHLYRQVFESGVCKDEHVPPLED